MKTPLTARRDSRRRCCSWPPQRPENRTFACPPRRTGESCRRQPPSSSSSDCARRFSTSCSSSRRTVRSTTYFGTFPGADGATTAVISTGEEIPLGHTPDVTPRDLGHEWEDTHLAMDDGQMDRFDLVTGGNVNGDMLSMSQHLDSDIPNYWNYAEHFALADHMFSSLAGPSFPNHLYTVAAQSGGVFTNPNALELGLRRRGERHRRRDGRQRQHLARVSVLRVPDRRRSPRDRRRIVALLRAGARTARLHLVSARRDRPHPADFALGRSRAERRTVPRRRLERHRCRP